MERHAGDAARAARLVVDARRLAARGRLREATAALDAAGRALPLAQVFLTKASLHRQLCETERALAALDRAAALPGGDAARLRRALLLPPMARSRESLDADRRRVEADLAALAAADPPPAIDDPLAAIPSVDFYLAYHGRNDAPFRGTLGALLRRACPALTYRARHCREGRPPNARPRVGFVSSHFRDHTIGRLNEGLLAELSRERFAPVVIFVGGIADDFAAAIASRAARTVAVPRDLAEARARIAAEELDLLYFTDVGMDAFTYFLAFARLAPVQCATWGHPVTTGVDTIDWFVSSEALETEASAAHYTERLARLADPMVFYRRPPDPAPPAARAALGLPDGRRVYACPQSLFKLHPDFDPLLAEILRRDPDGVLVLLRPRRDEWAEVLLARLARRLPDPARRIRFVEPMPRAGYLRLLADADVVLDPPHFGGGNSTLEALSVGAPVVTLPSRFLRGRISLACYRVLGVDDCVAGGGEDYVETAVAIATDRDRREALRERLRSRVDVLWENRTAVTEHERFFARALDGGAAAVNAPARVRAATPDAAARPATPLRASPP